MSSYTWCVRVLDYYYYTSLYWCNISQWWQSTVLLVKWWDGGIYWSTHIICFFLSFRNMTPSQKTNKPKDFMKFWWTVISLRLCFWDSVKNRKVEDWWLFWEVRTNWKKIPMQYLWFSNNLENGPHNSSTVYSRGSKISLSTMWLSSNYER